MQITINSLTMMIPRVLYYIEYKSEWIMTRLSDIEMLFATDTQQQSSNR